MVTRAELLPLPRPLGLKGMGGEHHGRFKDLLEKTAGQVGIPCVAMNDIRLSKDAHHGDVSPKGVHQLALAGINSLCKPPGLNARDLSRTPRLSLVSETENLDLMAAVIQGGELSGQTIHMNTRAPVNVGRELFGQHTDFHGRITSLLPNVIDIALRSITTPAEPRTKTGKIPDNRKPVNN
jgi:hypothetical protein